MAKHRRKYALCKKFLQVKIVKDSILYKKVSGHICLSPLKGKPEGSKDCHFPNIKIYENGKVYTLSKAEHCQKDALCQKMIQIKIVKDSIWTQKSQRARMSISHQRVARGLQRLQTLKY